MNQNLFFLFLLISLEIKAQVNLIPNPGFENGCYGCNHFNSLSCDYNNSAGINSDLDSWNVAEHNWDAGGALPNWLNLPNGICNLKCKNDVLSNAVVVGATDIKKVIFIYTTPKGVANKPQNQKFYHGAVRSELTSTLVAGETYTFRIKLVPLSLAKQYDYQIYNGLNHLRVIFSEEGEKWYKKNTVRYEANTYNNKIRTVNINDNCSWFFEETQFTVPSNMTKLKYIILYAEEGAWAIDGVEVFKKCPNELLIENRIYDWFYSTSGNPFTPLVERANTTLKAGRDVNPNTSNGDVIVQNGAVITYNAGTKIELLPGFRTETGAKFVAEISPCPYPRIGYFEDETTDTEWMFDTEEENENPSSEISELRTPDFQLQIHPNPSASGIFEIQGLRYEEQSTNPIAIGYEVRGKSDSYRITVTNVLGETILHHSITPSPHHQLNLSTHPKGIYFVQIQSGEGFSVHKVVYR